MNNYFIHIPFTIEKIQFPSAFWWFVHVFFIFYMFLLFFFFFFLVCFKVTPAQDRPRGYFTTINGGSHVPLQTLFMHERVHPWVRFRSLACRILLPGQGIEPIAVMGKWFDVSESYFMIVTLNVTDLYKTIIIRVKVKHYSKNIDMYF